LIISFRCLTFILARLIMTTPNYHWLEVTFTIVVM
jgi:hypothetical protein